MLANGATKVALTDVLCLQECKSNHNTVLAVTARGGHVAFLSGWWPFRASWMDKVAVQFFDTCNRMPHTHLDLASNNQLSS